MKKNELWYNDEITKAGGLTFKASSLIAKGAASGRLAERGDQAGRFQGFLGVEEATGRPRSGANRTYSNAFGHNGARVTGRSASTSQAGLEQWARAA